MWWGEGDGGGGGWGEEGVYGLFVFEPFRK